MKYPAPAELDAAGVKTRDLSDRVGQAIAKQHPGVQIDTVIEESGFRYALKHPEHTAHITARYLEGSDMVSVGRANAMAHYIDLWLERLSHALRNVGTTNANGDQLNDVQGFMAVADLMAKVKKDRKKFIFIGNGGSAGISSHMAEDFTKNGGVRSVTFNDAALLTCYANDYGWDEAFAKCVYHYGAGGDVLVGISSSGASKNICNAAAAAKAMGITPVTLSGFSPDNPLRGMGTINFWVPSRQYGFVETAHAALLHAILDIANGWVGQK